MPVHGWRTPGLKMDNQFLLRHKPTFIKVASYNCSIIELTCGPYCRKNSDHADMGKGLIYIMAQIFDYLVNICNSEYSRY